MYGRGKKLRKKQKTKEKFEENIIKSIRNIFIPKKGKKEVKDRKNRVITILEQEDDYYKTKRVSNFQNNDYIEHESSDNRNKTLSLKRYLEKIKPFLRDVITDI